MKKLILSLFIFQAAFAQTDSTYRTLLNGKINSIGLVASASFAGSTMNGTFLGGPLVGGGLLFNQKFYVGLSGQGLSKGNLATGDVYTRASLGGLTLAYTPKPYKLAHVSFPLTIGGGMASSDTLGTISGYDRYFGKDFGGKGGRGGNRGGDWYGDFGPRGNMANRTEFAFVQPGVNLEVNILKFASLTAGVNYRIGLGSSSTTLTNAKLSGLGVQVGLKSNFFTYKIKRKSEEQY